MRYSRASLRASSDSKNEKMKIENIWQKIYVYLTDKILECRSNDVQWLYLPILFLPSIYQFSMATVIIIIVENIIYEKMLNLDSWSRFLFLHFT